MTSKTNERIISDRKKNHAALRILRPVMRKREFSGMKSIIFFLFALVSQIAMAGDYMLYVANEGNTSECAMATRWTVHTSREVSRSFVEYFSGQKPDIAILQPAFANGHFRFCGSAEVNEVLAVLYKIEESGPAVNKLHLSDFIGKIEAIK